MSFETMTLKEVEESYQEMINDDATFTKMCDDLYSMNNHETFREIMRVCLAHQYIGQMRIEQFFKQNSAQRLIDADTDNLLESM